MAWVSQGWRGHPDRAQCELALHRWQEEPRYAGCWDAVPGRSSPRCPRPSRAPLCMSPSWSSICCTVTSLSPLNTYIRGLQV